MPVTAMPSILGALMFPISPRLLRALDPAALFLGGGDSYVRVIVIVFVSGTSLKFCCGSSFGVTCACLLALQTICRASSGERGGPICGSLCIDLHVAFYFFFVLLWFRVRTNNLIRHVVRRTPR